MIGDSCKHDTLVVVPSAGWTGRDGEQIHMRLLQEEDGGYSVIALNLPGAASSGDTVKEAVANLRDAVRELLASYADLNKPVPWRDSREKNTPETDQWIMIDE